MKNLFLLSILLLLVSCKQEPVKQLKYADVDTSTNEVIHLTDADDYYFSLEDVVEMNKGKVIYVNFFNSFTEVELMRAVEALEKKYDSNDFVIVNIITDTAMLPFENHLQKTTLQHNYIVRNFPQANFFSERNFQVIPRYMIYDTEGKLLDDNALRPDNSNLDMTIETLLNQK